MKKKVLTFDNKQDFMKEFKKLMESGMDPNRVNVKLPNPDHEVEHLLEEYFKPSRLKFFTLGGGLTGFISGFALTIGTVLAWPLITSGKPLISIPPFIVIAFELTILFGALASLTGFFLLGRFPKISKIIEPEDFGNDYVIEIEGEGA